MTTSPAEPPESTLAAVLADAERVEITGPGGTNDWVAALSAVDRILADRAARIAQLEADLAAAEAKALNDAADALEGGLGVEGTPRDLYGFRLWLRARAALATQPAP